MRFRPNDIPDMELNEARRITFDLAGAVGTNTLSAPVVTCDALTVGTPTVSGKTIGVTITASRIGTHMVKCQATLSSSETVIGVARVRVTDTTMESNQDGDYGR